MSLKEKIAQDLKEAMKEKQEFRLSVLRMLSSAIRNKEIEKRSKTGQPEELTDEEVIAVLRAEVKKRKDAAESFQKGGRMDLAEKERNEITLIEPYLPKELSNEELEKIVRDVIAAAGGITEKDFGRIMGEVMKRVKGQAAGDRVSRALKIYFEK